MTRRAMTRRVGSDTGGTFTDLVADDGTIAKVPSVPGEPATAVRSGLGVLGLDPASLEVLGHGTTVATNALLERTGARVALVTNRGLADVIEIARQDRPSLYDPFADRPVPPVARADRHEIAGRLAASGQELEPLDDDEVRDLAHRLVAETGDGGAARTDPSVAEGPRVGAVAICLLHADRDATHEQRVVTIFREAGLDAVASHEISPEFREYERTITTAIDATLRPVCRTGLHRLDDLARSVMVLTSAGGLVPVGEAAEHPARLLLSGPAGGVAAGAALAAVAGFADAVTFDMGGTSTDVCLVLGGRAEPAAQRSVAGFPVRVPSLDVHTIGAGGGSIARIDTGGALVVGPESAGAVPGPACYGRGGSEPTVTDADLVLGRIPVDHALPGLGVLDEAAAETALEAVGGDAAGVVAVVDEAMTEAVRQVSVARGVDPRGLALVAFGGAGPLHACAVAEALEMAAVVVPARAGVLSALGVLGAPRQLDVVVSVADPGDHGTAARQLAELGEGLGARLVDEGADPASVSVELSMDCRYRGQSHELSVASVGAFAAEHERRNGYVVDGAEVEVLALRAVGRVASPVSPLGLPAPARERVAGPAVVAEPDCTIWVPPGWVGEAGAAGSLVLRRVQGAG